MAMRNKHKEKRMAQDPGDAPEGLRLRSADQKGRTGRLRGWSDSEEGEGQVEKPKRKKRRAVTTAVEHELDPTGPYHGVTEEEGGHFHATHLGQPGTYEEEPVKVRKKQADAQPREKKKKGAAEKESKAEVRHKTKLAKTMKEEKQKDKKEKKKRKKDHADYPEAYGMMGQAMLAPMMGMMRSMSYPMMPGMMMMPGGIIGAPLMGGPVGHMGLHGTPMAYSLPAPGVPMVRALPKASSKKAEEERRRFTEAPPAPEAVPEAPEEQEPEKRSASVSSSSSSSSTSEAKNEGPPTAPPEPVPAPAGQDTLGEGELELGLISPPEKEEHSPLQVPPGMESPVASQSPDANPEASRLDKPSSWVEVEGETMEELQRELEVTCQNKPCVSIATQTDELPTATQDLSEGLAERWFLGFVDAAAAVPGTKESSGSSSSDEEDATCRPERQLRRRSRSQSQGIEGIEEIEGPEAKANAEAADAEAEASSSSSSSSSSGPRKRQRAPSSDEEATKATQSLAPQPPVDPRRLRMVQDYSDVA